MHKTFHFLRWSGKKAVAFFILTIVLATALVGSTLAYVIVKTQELKNQFDPPHVEIAVQGNTIQNKSDVPMYVRATIVATFIDEDGNTSSFMPTDGIDYLLTLDTENWLRGSDGFYYYKSPVAAGASVSLVTKAVQSIDGDNGLALQIQVVASSIQTDPSDVVTSAWPAVSVNSNGDLILN